MKRIATFLLLALLTGCTSPSPVKVVTVPASIMPPAVDMTVMLRHRTNVWVPPPAITNIVLPVATEPGIYTYDESSDLVHWQAIEAFQVTSNWIPTNTWPVSTSPAFFRWSKYPTQ